MVATPAVIAVIMAMSLAVLPLPVWKDRGPNESPGSIGSLFGRIVSFGGFSSTHVFWNNRPTEHEEE